MQHTLQVYYGGVVFEDTRHTTYESVDNFLEKQGLKEGDEFLLSDEPMEDSIKAIQKDEYWDSAVYHPDNSVIRTIRICRTVLRELFKNVPETLYFKEIKKHP